MARNSGGTYSLPAGNPVVTGTAISSTTHNSTQSDIASELTDSLCRSGKGPMLAALELADGSVSVPGLSFDNDPDCGLYRIGTNNYGAAVSGAKVVDFSTAGIGVTGTLSSTGKLSSSAADAEVPANKDFTYAAAVTRAVTVTPFEMLDTQSNPIDLRIEQNSGLPRWTHASGVICGLSGTVKLPAGATVTGIKFFATNTDGTNRALTFTVKHHATDLASTTTGFTSTTMANAVAVTLVNNTHAWRDITIAGNQAVGSEGQIHFTVDYPNTSTPDTIKLYALRVVYTQTAIKPAI